MQADLAAELARAIRGEVRFDPYSRALYSTDASAYQIEPVGVVIPRDRDDLQAVVEITGRHNVPVLARGGGSSLAGQAVGQAVVVDVSKYMHRVLEINPGERWVRAEPGVVCDALNAALKPHGLMLGPDPASSNRATLGGMLGNNATGAHSIMYGMMADHVLAAEAVLEDASAVRFGALDPAGLDARLEAGGREGEIYRGLASVVGQNAGLIAERFPRTWRRASGYSLNYLLPIGQTRTRPSRWYAGGPYPPPSGFNLAPLLAGSEGTLAVAAELTLRLVPRPRLTGLCVVHFDTIVAAAEATPAILESGPSAVELVDRLMIDLARGLPGYAPQLTFIEGQPGAILIVEYFAETEAELIARIDSLEQNLRGAGLADTFVRALTPAQQAQVWGVRKVGLGLITSMRGDAKPAAFMEDVAVPVERLGEYVRAVERMFADAGLTSAFYAHASAGCLHIRPVLNLKSAADVARMREMAEAVLEIVIEMGGAMSGEHGDGLSRSAWNGRLFGPELYAVFQEVKRLFDPRWRLNPGKVVSDPAAGVPEPDLTRDLRTGPAYRAQQLDTALSFAREGGFAAAVEQCSGMGICRKAEGTMCPSYMATREEEHSTRGRANALRAALSGRLPPGALTSERMHAVLDLCLECKACKTECPAGVDMAKIKSEFLSQHNAAHGVPLRARLFGRIHALSRLIHRAAPLVNWALGLGPVRRLNEKLIGVSRHRRLPPFVFRPFRDWFAEWREAFCARDTLFVLAAPAPPQPLILFVDTFTNFNHPEIGKAAVRVLEAAGFDIQVAEHGCCGRPMISKGLLDEARSAARRMVDALAPYAERGWPIVGLEPSCLLTLRDEYSDLLPGDERVAVVARQAVLIEELLAGQAARGQLKLKWNPNPPAVLAHAHCYQKALTGSGALLQMLRLPGGPVAEINSGCCGMAGSFGYEAEHYAISQAIGEDRLFPAVRAAPPGTRIAAAGMSCRHQIAHGTGRAAEHPIQILADALFGLHP